MIALKGWKLVPEQPSEEQWSGLARDLMFWMDIYPGSAKTPRALFKFLHNLGRDIPQWLRDEPEMRDLNHVPSKGTRVAIIYKAMLAAAPSCPAVGMPTEEELVEALKQARKDWLEYNVRREDADPLAVVSSDVFRARAIRKLLTEKGEK